MSRSGGPVRRWALDVSPLRASPAFRAAFAARLVSLLGIGLLVVAVPVQTYQLTGSSLHVAAVATTTAVAMLAGSLAGGVLADRVERRRLIQLSRSAAGAAFAVLGVNALLEDPSLPVVYVASAVDGLAGGVSGAALMAVVPGLVGRDRLAAAGALIALTTDLGTLAGPALAGLVIAAGGLATTYLAAAAATALTVVLVTAIGPCPVTRTSGQSPVRALAAAVRFAAGEPVVRSVLLVGVLTALVSGPVVLLPAYVEEVLHAGPTTLGLLYAAPAAGAVLGSLTSGWTGRVQGGGRLLLAAVAVMALGPALLGLSTGTLWAFLALAGSGLGRVVADVLRFALLQRSTPDDVRGRVSGLWQVQAVTGTAVGSAAAGLLGRWFPPDTALVVHGVGGLVLTVLLVGAVRPLLRPPTPVPAPILVPRSLVPRSLASRSHAPPDLHRKVTPVSEELTAERVRADVAALLGCPPADLDDAEDLFEEGLDSVRLMSLVARWRGDGATGLEYADLAEEPVLSRWTALVTAARVIP